MSPQFRLKKLTAYPDWHQQPHLLNCAEMEGPYTVLTAFFDRYHLSGIRISLQQLLEDALKGTEEEACSHFYTHENIARLVEAAWMIHGQRRQAEADEGFENRADEAISEDFTEAESAAEERRRFVKWVPFPARLKASPLEYLKRVFEVSTLDHLRNTIGRWQRIALSAAYDRYDTAGERADLLDYCEGLHRLLNAGYVLQHGLELGAEGKTKWPLPGDLKEDLLTAEQRFCLDEEELKNPGGVIGRFFEQFAPPYARRELWDLLACAVECRQADQNRTDLLLDYECLYAVVEAGWLFSVQPGETAQLIEDHKSNGV